jgi:hypothetical protein
LGFGVSRIHTEQVAGENSSLIATSASANFEDDVFFVVGIFGDEKKLQFALNLFLTRGELPFFFLRHVAHLGVFGFHDHLTSTREVFFDLLELPVLIDDFLEVGVLFGKLLEASGIRDDFGAGKLLGHFLVTNVELVEFFTESKN